MVSMTKNSPHSRTMGNKHDYLPAAGHDAFLPVYDLFTRLLGVRGIHRTLVDQAELAPGAEVLEIGCGTGNLTLLSADAAPGASLVGTDPDPRALARAERKRKHRENVRFDRAYSQELPFPDASFDRVLSAFMWHHLDSDVKRATAAELHRVLRPGARLHLVDVAGHPTPTDGRVARRMHRNPHLAENLGDAIPNLLSDNGFDCAETSSRAFRRFGRITWYRATRR
ncbi:methyltransferase family protein [Nocardia puris]|uniref:Methyltransferase family protein n=2 Tax=Nocardia puris TaxID=208602 RepID=A0A366DU43_9NOCA|nr:methyltransferase family protein [Nocardia puris]